MLKIESFDSRCSQDLSGRKLQDFLTTFKNRKEVSQKLFSLLSLKDKIFFRL